MGYHTYKLIICIICLLLCFEWCCVEGLAVIWDPYHPLFSCKDPVVNVKETDLLKFVCPDKDISSKPNAHSSTLHEVAYLLDYTKEQDYANCDARDHLSVLLNCTAAYRTTQHRITQNALSPDAPSFTPGKTYYVIATSFQTSNNINNLVGGSCNYSQDGAHNLKLKIHVCDGSDSSCSVCDNEACLYKDCGKSCGNWTNGYTFKRDGGCFSVEKRLCNNTLLGITNHEEQREVALDCYENCTTWELNNYFKKNDLCYVSQLRYCNDSVNKDWNKVNYREFKLDCYTNCTEWGTSNHFKKNNLCFVTQRRFCNDTFTNQINKVEYHEIQQDCYENCSTWELNNYFKKNDLCYVSQLRYCNDSGNKDWNKVNYREFKLDCPKTCSAWEQLNLYQKGDNCYKDEIRSCNISILESFNNKEYRQSIFDCKDNCTDLITSSTFERIGSCFLSTKKTCVNEVLNISRTEYNETEVDCPTIVIPTGAPNKGDPGSDDEELYKYMLIPVGAVCLIIGVALGCMGHRYQNVKNRCKNNNVSPEMNHNNGRNRGGVANPSYTPDSVIINDTPEMIRNGGI
ncbi:uncharacterized protein [Clytia hemisphaerica]|uniref:uncharacterized protein isoform X2 n=1 Tax=Clytia hemisphaerica TaxID=252671 RepID=UPI0034D64FBA